MSFIKEAQFSPNSTGAGQYMEREDDPTRPSNFSKRLFDPEEKNDQPSKERRIVQIDPGFDNNIDWFFNPEEFSFSGDSETLPEGLGNIDSLPPGIFDPLSPGSSIETMAGTGISEQGNMPLSSTVSDIGQDLEFSDGGFSEPLDESFFQSSTEIDDSIQTNKSTSSESIENSKYSFSNMLADNVPQTESTSSSTIGNPEANFNNIHLLDDSNNIIVNPLPPSQNVVHSEQTQPTCQLSGLIRENFLQDSTKIAFILGCINFIERKEETFNFRILTSFSPENVKVTLISPREFEITCVQSLYCPQKWLIRLRPIDTHVHRQHLRVVGLIINQLYPNGLPPLTIEGRHGEVTFTEVVINTLLNVQSTNVLKNLPLIYQVFKSFYEKALSREKSNHENEQQEKQRVNPQHQVEQFSPIVWRFPV